MLLAVTSQIKLNNIRHSLCDLETLYGKIQQCYEDHARAESRLCQVLQKHYRHNQVNQTSCLLLYLLIQSLLQILHLQVSYAQAFGASSTSTTTAAPIQIAPPAATEPPPPLLGLGADVGAGGPPRLPASGPGLLVCTWNTTALLPSQVVWWIV